MSLTDDRLAERATDGVAYRSELEQVRAWNLFMLAVDVEERAKWPARKADRP